MAGYVRDARNGEAIMGVNITVDTLSITRTTDQFGYYSLTLSWQASYQIFKRRNERHQAAGRGIQRR